MRGLIAKAGERVTDPETGELIAIVAEDISGVDLIRRSAFAWEPGREPPALSRIKAMSGFRLYPSDPPRWEVHIEGRGWQ